MTGARQASRARSARRRSTERRPPRLSRQRAAALLAMVAAVALTAQLVSATTFGLAAVQLSSLRWSDAAVVRDRVDVPLGTNLFTIRASAIETRLASLPAVARARVAVALPDRLTVTIDEREPALVWAVGDARYLVDAGGAVFALVDATALADLQVPTVLDARPDADSRVRIGTQIDPIDLDVATRLAGVTPADLGSSATSLQIGVDDSDGFTLSAVPDSWVAVFGPYGAALRGTDLIPGQVRLLRSLLAGREPTVARVILADDRNGTYVPRTPAP